jgi:hypothetical protein
MITDFQPSERPAVRVDDHRAADPVNPALGTGRSQAATNMPAGHALGEMNAKP